MSGCGDVVVDNQNHGYYVSEYDELTLVEKNEMIEDYALILASSMDNDELRSTIKSEAQLKFDGDYDILIQTLENKVIHEKGFVIKELLAKSHSDLNLKSGEKSGNFKSSNLTG
ncbi:MAG TPA: hypothetical protein VJ909_07645, partial [Prolixibacteraceae bacterium]|nr:hypothetical protein [Prolixibacteraceae bacterium]